MSLTLEEVRRVRFRMARPRETGYAVADVDNFIDKVEESFAAFENDRDLLRRELESAGTTTGGADNSAELNEARAAIGAKDQELESLRAELERARQEATQARQEADNAHAQVSGRVDEQIEKLNAANQELQRRNAELEAQNEQLRSQLESTREELNQARNDRITNAGGQPQHITVHAAEDAAPAVTRLLQMATDQASTLVAEAETEAARKIADAEQRATEIKTDARTRAERIESEARVNAEQMTSEAEGRASRLDSDTEARRTELFADLEREQGELTLKVDALRRFEGEYRSNLGGTLQRMLQALNDDHPEPGDVPELAQRRSDTPRLDALAGGTEE
ncbi:DivIVA domain-containing protein [Tessaracoccus oleiagri]|uniref:Cell wall synthesis protein Wag31 n=1 Tax=Tessaracoccus oleiagri TaxID=686624 RepID=A0A1G9L2M9_9ACTN|nr:DivIVA domain-containing protein [Tessaracoccus oleiagri]SDL56212.1 DivIVA domain-containing protein [Tessaracoccus oleiagri]